MGKIIDLTGQIFGELTVLYQDEKVLGDNRARWVCQCSCGNIKKGIPGVNLRNGKTKSCGCLVYNNKKNIKDLSGKIFGLLKVIKDSGERQNGNVMWECECQSCGEIILARGSHLISGDIKSCGVCSLLKKDVINHKFGLLTVKKYNKQEKKYECSCECGNTTLVNLNDLTSEHTKSCGCLKSFGEYKIINILKNNNIDFIYQYKNENCKFQDTNKMAIFDFYLPDRKIIIEYDGEQHFIQGTGVYNNLEKFQKTQEHDTFKNEWCKENGITLIRIPYTHLKEICLEDLLENSSFIKEVK